MNDKMNDKMNDEMSDEEFEKIRKHLQDLILYCFQNPDDVEANKALDDISEKLDKLEQEAKELDRIYYGEDVIDQNRELLEKFKKALENE